MQFNPKVHNRRSIRLQEYDYSQDGFYYITICTRNRECIFGEILNGEIELSKIGKIANECWNQIPKHFNNVMLDEMIIMPNHLHGIVIVENNHCRGLINQTPTDWILQRDPRLVLGKIIRFYKARTTRLIHKNEIRYFTWQRNYYEHIIHNEKELYAIREYIINNPLQWHLDKNYSETTNYFPL